MGHAPSSMRYKHLPYRCLLNRRSGGILEGSALRFSFICSISLTYTNHTDSWLAHLFINDAGDIDLAKEDPNGKLKYLFCYHHRTH